ncbi:uncharacterized protein TRIVIDRAFT_48107 [Trichoderma virens Gv29-8]|uniref:Amine oxidase domain-containing protein n=1 Tax=Hypocrea virens (strain Gv29-8 / FGSC 10586) TaxID=413071 RepID=G9MZZ4_HYPVG|nr:uncharacterized protein TRIVIDRAFT_48107 [Trichoderma virens Gv29-8]EHK20199.1 hypothetical protein TRIVIDRAFT_48107 [Trichoderma virens Gv29-8]
MALQLGVSSAAPSNAFDPSLFNKEDVIQKDSVVIGCGAAGAYGAIKLQDSGKDVLVIEQRGRCGGHVASYIDPATSVNINAAVVILVDLPETQAFFKRVGVTLGPATDLLGDKSTNIFVDFQSGKLVNYTMPDPLTLFGLITKYTNILTTQYPWLSSGWNLPDPVPKELVQSFGDWLLANDLEGLAYPISLLSQRGEITAMPAIYGLMQFNVDWATQALVGFVAAENMQDIYDNAFNIINSMPNGIFLNTTIVSTQRQDGGTSLIINTPRGQKLVQAKNTLMTGLPTISNLKGWDLDDNEILIFSQFTNGGYAGGVVKSSTLNVTPSWGNVAPNGPFFVPSFPAVNVFGAKDPQVHNDLFMWYFNTPQPMETDAIVSAVNTTLNKLGSAGVLDTRDISFPFSYNHKNYFCNVPADAIASGFYKQLYALQGKRSTVWSGATWFANSHSGIYQFTDKVVKTYM